MTFMSKTGSKLKHKLLKNGRKGLAGIVLYLILKWTLIILAGTYLQSKTWWNNAYFLGFPLIVLVIWYLKKRRLPSKNSVLE